MRWYAAHVILFVEYKDGVQDHYPVWENILLIYAAEINEVAVIAEKRARQDEGDCDNSYTCDGRPARLKFAGIRKIIECEADSGRLSSGREISYGQFEVATADELRLLAEGKEVRVIYVE